MELPTRPTQPLTLEAAQQQLDDAWAVINSLRSVHKENRQLKHDNQQLKKDNDQLTQDVDELKQRLDKPAILNLKIDK